MATFLFSCQDDEDASRTEPFDVTFADVPPVFLPLAVGNYWIYEIAKVDTFGNEELLPLNDTISIVGDTILNGETFYVMVDGLLGFGPKYTFVRDSSGFLLELNGNILYSSSQFDEVLTTVVTGPAQFDYTMKSGLQTVSAPLGDFECLNFEGIVSHTSDEDYAPRKLFNFYSEDVGLVSSNIFFFSSRQFEWERRLIDFHLE